MTDEEYADLQSIPELRREYVYEVMGDEASHLGLYTTLEKAKEAALILNNPEVQVNRIPLNTFSHFGEGFDCVWSAGDEDDDTATLTNETPVIDEEDDYPRCENGIACCRGDCDLCQRAERKCFGIGCIETAVYANQNGDLSHCHDCGHDIKDEYGLIRMKDQK